MQTLIILIYFAISSELQVEAARVLKILASGTSDQKMTILRAEAVPILLKLLHSNDTNLAFHSVGALGEIAGDGPVARDAVLNCGAAEVIAELLQHEQPVRK